MFVCIASGPSLTREQTDLVGLRHKFGGFKVIAVSDSWKWARYANYIYACDRRWWDAYYHDVRTLTDAKLYTMDRGAAVEHKLNWIESDKMHGLGRNGKIAHGQHSGYQAINLAYLLGAKKILLLGYDCRYIDDKRHFFGDHPKGWGNANRTQAWIHNYKTLAPELEKEGVEVINCSPGTAIKSFKTGDLWQHLKPAS